MQAPLSTPLNVAAGDVPREVLQFPGAERWAGPVRFCILALSDTAALLLAGMVAFMLWANPVLRQDASLYLPVAPLALLLIFAYAQAGLYPGFGLGPVERLRRYWLVTTTAFVAITALVFVLKVENLYSRVTVTLALLFSLALVPLLRWLTLRVANRWRWWPEPVVLIVGSRGTGLAQRLIEQPQTGEFQAVATLKVPLHESNEGATLSDVVEEGRRLARANVRVAFADLTGPGADLALDQLMMAFRRVIIVRQFAELPVEGVQVRNLGGVLGLEYGNNLLRWQSRWVKRTLDLGIGATALLLTLPITLTAMLVVKLVSRGPALFWHVREGRLGRPIRVPKIRTMVLDAEEQMEQLFRTRPELRTEWETAFKLRSDPRVVPVVGRLFRRFSIDELPQLWSVLRGDMSLVGPRPFPAYHLNVLSPHARRLRDQVRPGITGMWQVTARGEAGVEAQQAHDVYYIRNWSPWLDLYILARTVSAVLSGRGAY